jgi:hypothetical protein
VTATIERSSDRDVHLDLVELDLLTVHAGVRSPFPLRVPSFGRLARERDALLSSAGHTLRARGLATEHGPAGMAAELVTALREYRSAVELVVIGPDSAMGPGSVVGTVAMVDRNGAVVCTQSLGDEAGPVRVRRVPTAALTDELAGLIPQAAPAPAMPITLPPGAVGDTLRLLSNTADTPATRRCVRELVRECGGDGAVVDQLVELFPALRGRGQLGVVRRSGTVVSRPLEVSWLDSPHGRVRVDHDDKGWMSVNPLRHGELVRLLGEAATVARA